MNNPLAPPPAYHRAQKKQEARFICSACGADRSCKCNAPAIDRVAEYDKANPGKSTRHAAADLGISDDQQGARCYTCNTCNGDRRRRQDVCR